MGGLGWEPARVRSASTRSLRRRLGSRDSDRVGDADSDRVSDSDSDRVADSDSDRGGGTDSDPEPARRPGIEWPVQCRGWGCESGARGRGGGGVDGEGSGDGGKASPP